MRFGLSVVLIVIAGWVSAQSYPEPSDLAVNDFAGILGEEAEAQLTETLDELREDTGVELVVLTLSRQDMFAPDETLKSFARGIFDEWGIGNKERDDGILVLVLRGDQAIRITLGKGYDRAADKASDKAVEKSFLPEFREDRYETGIERGVDDLIENLVTPYVAALDTGAEESADTTTAAADTASTETGTEPSTTPEALAQDTGTSDADAEEAKGGGSILLWILGGIGAVIAFFVVKSKNRKCPQCGAKGTLKSTSNTLVSPTETSAGKGERVTTCENCDYRDVNTYEISKREKSEPKKEEPPEDFSGGEAGKKGSTGKW